MENNIVQNRSANAGILGFTYQFIRTAIDILREENFERTFIIEGIEDLDISNNEESELIQYKYHEDKKLTLSKIGKPVALMFKHFLDNEDKYNYTLYCYFKEDNGIDELKKSDLEKLLQQSYSTKILKNIKWSDNNLINFLRQFKIVKAKSFEDSLEELNDLLSNLFRVSKIESETLYVSNVIHYINVIATNRDELKRKVSREEIIRYLKEYAMFNQNAIIKRIYGKEKYYKKIEELMKEKSIKKGNKSFVFHIPNKIQVDSRDIIEIVQKFTVKDSKSNITPPTFIVEQDIEKLKKDLLILNNRENLNIYFNDGFESIVFDYIWFNKEPIIKLQDNRQRIKEISFNFKILSKEKFVENIEKIHFSYPVHFVLMENNYSKEKLEKLSNKIYLNIDRLNEVLKIIK